MVGIFSPRPDDWWLSVFNRVYLWAGVIAAISGVVAIVATRGIQFYSSRIDTAQKGHIAELELQTAQARRASSDALEGQSKLEVEAEKARVQQRALEAQIAQSGADQERLRTENLELQSKVEKERLARLQIEERLAPRSLSRKGREAIAAELTPLGRQRIDFLLYPNDAEIVGIAEQLAQALQMAGWTVVTFQPIVGGTVSGMRLEFDPRDALATRRASVLVKAIASFGLAIQGPIPSLATWQNFLPYASPNGEKIEASIRLIIGRK